ncbi:hypothetical protein B0H10DRAFT_776067 [Mycena sp. CBHHK59/15]|nr:hypothetical protein B0H10DRAFT_776067 [Mycena sp. CBHHK59/15]
MCEGTADSEEYGYMSDSDLDPESDDEDVSGFPTSAPNVPLPPSRPPSPEPRRMGRVVILRDTAFNTWNALLYYLYTHKIRFTAGPRLRNLSVRSKIPECSPKSMYRLADKLGLDDLKARSLSSIKACLSRENIVREAFASFTSMYPEVQDITVEFLIKNFAEVTPELYRVLKCICDEERPHCYDVLRKIVAGRNENKRGPAGVQGAAVRISRN